MIKLTKILFLSTFLISFGQPCFAEGPSEIKWESREYQENSLVQSIWAERFFLNQYQYQGNEKILDIGSGTGNITANIADFVPEGYVIGLDKSDSMVKSAKRRYHHVRNLSFVRSAAEDRTFYAQHAEDFDVLVSFSTLHWVSDQKSVLDNVYTALKPKGKFYLKLSSDGSDPIQSIADKLVSHSKYSENFAGFVDPINRYSADDYRVLVADSKLVVDSIEDVEEHDRFESLEDLAKQIKSWMPHYQYLRDQSESLADEFIDDIIAQYIHLYPPAMDGSVVLYDHYLEVVGHKDALA